MLDGAGPLMLVLGPSLFIFLSSVSLLQFKALYQLFAHVATTRTKNALLQGTVQPLLRKLLTLMEASLGAPAAFTPSTTHVLLVAILLAVLATRKA